MDIAERGLTTARADGKRKCDVRQRVVTTDECFVGTIAIHAKLNVDIICRSEGEIRANRLDQPPIHQIRCTTEEARRLLGVEVSQEVADLVAHDIAEGHANGIDTGQGRLNSD